MDENCVFVQLLYKKKESKNTYPSSNCANI